MKKEIALFLMTKKGNEVLKALVEDQLQSFIGLVVIGKDKNQYDFSEETTKICITNSIPYCLSDSSYNVEKFDYGIAIGWRWILNMNNLIVLHDALLPKYRGFAPLVNALLNNERKIGATAIWASNRYDEGDIILQKSIDIMYPIKIEKAIDIMASCYVDIVREIFQIIVRGGRLRGVSQNNNEATYSLWKDEDDYHLDWTQSSKRIQLKVNSLGNPYKGAYSILEQKKVRILDVEVVGDVKIEHRDCGKVLFVIENKPYVVCGSGMLIIREAVFDETKKSILPLKSFRTKFK